MANSFRAEGYGAASALLLVISYIEVHNIPTDGNTWTLHINNKSMVDRLAEHTTPWKRKSKHQTRPEADITNIADKLMQKISHVQVKHIKSQQDSTSLADQLSWLARLNIIADRQTTEQREEMEGPVHNVTNTTKGMLHIRGMAVTRNVEQTLWRTASGIPIQDYYKARHGWTNTTFHQINWEAQHKALLRFQSADQQCILKIVHNWLQDRISFEKKRQTYHHARYACTKMRTICTF
jgi:hypothetical protein